MGMEEDIRGLRSTGNGTEMERSRESDRQRMGIVCDLRGMLHDEGCILALRLMNYITVLETNPELVDRHSIPKTSQRQGKSGHGPDSRLSG